MNIPQNSNNSFNTLNFPLVVQPSAGTNQFGPPYALRITVGGSSSNCNSVPGVPTYQEDIPLQILAPAPTATPDKFVFVQGYALFQVTRYDPPNSGNPNTVFAQAISPLYQSYYSMTVGLRSRLMPWN